MTDNNNKSRAINEPHPRALKRLTGKQEKERWPRLNNKNKEVLRNYIELGNATESWSRVYPNVTRGSAAKLGSELLKREDARDYMNYIVEEYEYLVEMEMWEVMREMKKMALNPDVNSNTKFNAVKLLGQHKGVFTDKVEITNKDIIVSLED